MHALHIRIHGDYESLSHTYHIRKYRPLLFPFLSNSRFRHSVICILSVVIIAGFARLRATVSSFLSKDLIVGQTMPRGKACYRTVDLPVGGRDLWRSLSQSQSWE